MTCAEIGGRSNAPVIQLEIQPWGRTLIVLILLRARLFVRMQTNMFCLI
jgi:hypothetical protein